jgi:hypothetical protein
MQRPEEQIRRALLHDRDPLRPSKMRPGTCAELEMRTGMSCISNFWLRMHSAKETQNMWPGLIMHVC